MKNLAKLFGTCSRRLCVFVVVMVIGFAMVACEIVTEEDDNNNNNNNNTVVPSTPTGVSASADSSSSITVTWSSVTNATGYKVYRSSTSSGTFAEMGTPTLTSYTNTGLTANTTYYYKVAAYNSSGTSSQSSTVSATTNSGTATPPTTAPNAPVTVNVPLMASATSVTVTWSSVSGATGYRVYRSSSASGSYSLVGSSTSTSYTNTGLTSNTAYYYKVSAYNSIGESSQSSDYGWIRTTNNISAGLSTVNAWRYFYLEADTYHTFTISLGTGYFYVEWIDVDNVSSGDYRSDNYADVQVSVRRGNTTYVAMSDTGNNGTNRHRFNADVSGTYTIRVEGYSTTTKGVYEIRIL